MKADQQHLFARRTQVPAPTLRARFQPRAPDGRAIKPRLLISAIACLLPAATLAGPKDGEVVAGQSSISTPDANTTIIQQSTDKSVINWQSFSVGTKEYVKFVQPQTSSISLNRVIGGDPSSILGSLSANGQVYLVNPSGIYFGEGARVDVSGIVASVLDISNTDFMSGNFVFEGSADENLGKVINDGIINARNEGYVVLMGDYSENNGVIQAHMGKVVLASGSRVTMDISGNSLISVAVDEAAVNQLAGVKNSGEIYADGGRVIMTARVADNLIGSAVNNEGLVRANSIVENDGAIFLTAIGGDVTNSGTLDASAAADSNVDGGGVLVYSDRNITLSSGAAIHARGDGGGAGGVVRVIAEDVLDHQQGASISVAGSPHAGGFVEVSGHGGLRLPGEVDLGAGGTLLIDPATFRINTGPGGPNWAGSGWVGSEFLADKLNMNNDVYVVADTLITADPGVAITATSPTNTTAGVGDLNLVIGTIEATGSGAAVGGSSYSSQCNSAGFCVGGGVGNFKIKSDPTGDIELGMVDFDLGGGLNVEAGTGVGSVSLGRVINAASLNVAGGATAGSVTVGRVDVAGNVTVTAGSNVDFQDDIDAGGNVSISAGSDIVFQRHVRSAGGGLTANAGNDVVIDGDIIVGNHAVNLNANVDGTYGGDVNIDGGSGFCGEGCSGGLSVTTRGTMNISGENLNVTGVDFGGTSVSGDISAPVLVTANGNLNVTLTGKMTLKSRQVNTWNDNDADISVKVAAGNDMSIVAPGGLSIDAGTASASVSGSGSASAIANASLSAGRNVDITVANGDLVVKGGRAQAAASAYSNSYSATAAATANAAIAAGGSVTVNSVGGNVIVDGGSVTANATGSCSDCDAVARADARVSGGVVTLNNIGGDLSIQGGNANASGVGTSCDTCNMVANANAEVTGSRVSVNSLAGNLNVMGGNALARPEDEMMPGFASANAFAKLSASGNISIDAGNSVRVFAEQATVTGFWGSANTMNARANADAVIDAGGNLSVTVVAGLNIFGGTASANPNISGRTNGTASASAKAELKAGGLATVNVTAGSVTLIGGSPDPSGSSGTTPLRKAFANASVKADQLQVMAAMDVYGSSADIDAQGIYIAAGNDLHLLNTTTTVGNGVAPGVSGDPLVLDILEKAGIPLPANGDPNLKFQAGGTMHTGDIEATASNAYLWFETDEVLSVSSISAPSGPLMVQYSPFTPTLSIVFEDKSPDFEPSPDYEPPPDIVPRARVSQVNYDNSNHISPFPMTTFVLGSAKQSGPMTVGANGPIDIVARNILLLTTPDNVNSPDNVITTGIVATSGFVASGREVFIAPRLDSFEVDTETIWDEEEKRNKQLVETPEEDHGMCTAL